jgi:hypothetical protein
MFFQKTNQVQLTSATKDVFLGGSGTTIGVTVAKLGASYSLPWIMSTTGTVVSGVGTIQAPIVPVVASFAATPVALPTIAVGAVGYALYNKCRE